MRERVTSNWPGWKKLDEAIGMCGDPKAAEWCWNMGFVTVVQRVVDVAVGAGTMEVAVGVLSKWIKNLNVGVERTSGLVKSESESTLVAGKEKNQGTESGVKKINPHPKLLNHILKNDDLPVFMKLLPHLSNPIPPTTIPLLLSSPRILSYIFDHNIVPFESFLISLASATFVRLRCTKKQLRNKLPKAIQLKPCFVGRRWKMMMRHANGWSMPVYPWMRGLWRMRRARVRRRV